MRLVSLALVTASLAAPAVSFAETKHAPATHGTTVPAAPAASAAGAPAIKSLYDRLGGKTAIEAVVGEFLGNVTKDPKIKGFFAKTNAADLKKKLVDQICQATGGPCKYEGLDMKTAHSEAIVKKASGGKHSKINEDQFNALVGDLIKSLDKFKVGKAEKDELLGALGSMKGDIVSK